MCGICGFVGAGDMDDLHRMTNAMKHRGPDDAGFWCDPGNGVYLGHRRLSIIDISGGKQPMERSEGDLVITFNGEIYNHLELRKKLEQSGHVFYTDHSDTEVLLHGFRQWNERLPEKLNGMWAFALYDRNRKRMFLSRDRFGKKPLFWSFQENTFAFASELTALIKHRKISSGISQLGTAKYFAYGFIPAPNSIIEKVYKLPGGHNLVLDVGSLAFNRQKYWEFKLEPFQRIPKNPEKVWGEKLRALISDAVKRRLMSDVPLGIFLSGGMDSSAVAYYATRFAGNNGIKTFSVGFDEKSFDESAYSNKISDLLGTSHYLEVLSVEKARLLLPEIIKGLDEPMGDGSILPTYLLSAVTRKKVTVALGGDGADELFAGYDPFRVLGIARMYQKIVPKPIHEGIRMLAGFIPVSHQNMSLDFKVKRALRGLSYSPKFWHPVWLGPLCPGELNSFFNMRLDSEAVYSEAIELWESCNGLNLVDKTLQFYTRLYLQDDILVKVDRTGMMNSLEVRAPFLDIDLVNFVRRIPSYYKFRNRQTKYILKKALEPVLPRQILFRPKKGFGIPVGKWFQKGLLEINELQPLPFLNGRFTLHKLKEHRFNQEDHRAFLFNIFMMNIWLKNALRFKNEPSFG